MEHVEQVLRRAGVIPVIALEDEAQAVPLGNALLEGGIPAAEITFRTSAAAKSIEKLAAALPEMFVCAGHGAQCGAGEACGRLRRPKRSSPRAPNRDVVEWCVKNNVPVYPRLRHPPPRWRRLWAWA